MAISPRDIETHKKQQKEKLVRSIIGQLESYLDNMLVADHRNILIDKKIDGSIPINFRKLIKNDISTRCISCHKETLPYRDESARNSYA
jgi:hypothetical protein